MAHLFFGIAIGLFSAVTCALIGDITLKEAFLIYWIVGTAAPLLHIALDLQNNRMSPSRG